MHRLLLSLQAKRMIVLQLLLLSLQNNVDAKGLILIQKNIDVPIIVHALARFGDFVNWINSE